MSRSESIRASRMNDSVSTVAATGVSASVSCVRVAVTTTCRAMSHSPRDRRRPMPPDCPSRPSPSRTIPPARRVASDIPLQKVRPALSECACACVSRFACAVRHFACATGPGAQERLRTEAELALERIGEVGGGIPHAVRSGTDAETFQQMVARDLQAAMRHVGSDRHAELFPEDVGQGTHVDADLARKPGQRRRCRQLRLEEFAGAMCRDGGATRSGSPLSQVQTTAISSSERASSAIARAWPWNHGSMGAQSRASTAAGTKEVARMAGPSLRRRIT